MQDKDIRSHYNNLKGLKLRDRHKSKIINIRNMNNFIKSMLINMYAKKDVLDIGCGKGGDLKKYLQVDIDYYCGIDIADQSIREAERRYNIMKGKDSTLMSNTWERKHKKACENINKSKNEMAEDETSANDKAVIDENEVGKGMEIHNTGLAVKDKAENKAVDMDRFGVVVGDKVINDNKDMDIHNLGRAVDDDENNNGIEVNRSGKAIDDKGTEDCDIKISIDDKPVGKDTKCESNIQNNKTVEPENDKPASNNTKDSEWTTDKKTKKDSKDADKLFDASFLCADAYNKPINLHRLFDTISCQFSFHYAFESQETFNIAIENVAKHLNENGYFILTIPNSDTLLRRYHNYKNNYGNDYYKVSFKKSCDEIKDMVFGIEYFFMLEEAIDNCVEYLIRFKQMRKALEGYQIECVLYKDFLSFFNANVKKYLDLYNKMVKTRLNTDELKVIELYSVAVFKKMSKKQDA